MIRAVAVAMLLSSVVEAAPVTARVELHVRKPKHFLGENALVDFCVVNPTSSPITIDVGGDYRGSTRALRFKLEVRDAAGTVLADPDPNPFNMGGMSYSPNIAPGKRWCESLALWRYARIDRPGTYTIKATHDLGWAVGTAPTATATITFAMPTPAEAEAVVAAMEALPADPNNSAGEVRVDYADFSALRYDVYVTPLTARATRGKPTALAGLAEIPTRTATRAIVTLLRHRDPVIAKSAVEALSMRLPDPALTGHLGSRNPFENTMSEQRKYLSTRAWDPALADEVRAIAKLHLASVDLADIVGGAFMLEAVGTLDDAPDVVKALDTAIDRTRKDPVETNMSPPPRGACMELRRAVTILLARGLVPAASPSTGGEIAVWLEALYTGARPPGWEAELGRAMKHPTPYVRELAFQRAPDAVPASLVPSIKASLVDRDQDVVDAAAELAARAKLTALAPDVVKAMAHPTGLRLNIVSNAAYALGARYPRALALLARLDDAFGDAYGELLEMLDQKGGGRSGEPTAAEKKAVAAAWTKLVAAKRSAIEAGTKISLDDPAVTPALFPKSWNVVRANGKDFP
ncbi:MAG TPA: hypothetical protein VGO00_10415 [Kofleriaceae bacterium]|nr:hypothetical protein [Kofleriaceae bacterium]